MRIVTWNANMAFRNKKHDILDWNPDVLVIQESENPAHNGDWGEFDDWAWVGDNPNKGLAVYTRNGHTIDRIDTATTTAEYFHPVTVAGRTIIGVWAMNDKDTPSRRYIGQVHTALQDYDGLIDSDTIVAGDFNWNVQWDENPKSALVGDFGDVAGVLNDNGLVSAYHSSAGIEYGGEPCSTFFMHKKESKPYHTDYVFAPSGIVESGSVRVGRFDEWIDASDHMPVLLDTDA